MNPRFAATLIRIGSVLVQKAPAATATALRELSVQLDEQWERDREEREAARFRAIDDDKRCAAANAEKAAKDERTEVRKFELERLKVACGAGKPDPAAAVVFPFVAPPFRFSNT